MAILSTYSLTYTSYLYSICIFCNVFKVCSQILFFLLSSEFVEITISESINRGDFTKVRTQGVDLGNRLRTLRK